MQIRVETQPRLHGDGSGDQRPAKDCQKVPDQQANEDVNGRRPQCDESGSNDKFRCGHMFTGVQAREMCPAVQLVLGDWQLLRVHAGDDLLERISGQLCS